MVVPLRKQVARTPDAPTCKNVADWSPRSAFLGCPTAGATGVARSQSCCWGGFEPESCIIGSGVGVAVPCFPGRAVVGWLVHPPTGHRDAKATRKHCKIQGANWWRTLALRNYTEWEVYDDVALSNCTKQHVLAYVQKGTFW